ncbi:WIAG-tail domain, partial [Paenibacillus elgii]
ADHLCVESVDGLHIKQETISGYHLVPGTISFIHLEPSLQALLNRRSAEEAQDDAAHTAVDPEQFDPIGETEDPGIQSEIETPDAEEAEEAEISLESGAELVAELEPELAEVHISALNLLLDAVTAQISEADVTAGGQLQPESVRSEHLAAGAVTPEHLSFQPVQTVGVRTTVQQFGMSPFLLKLEDELTEVVLIFDRPFADNNYVLVASTDQTNTYAVIQQKEPDGAIIEVVRSKFSPELQGVVNWIAIGAANE